MIEVNPKEVTAKQAEAIGAQVRWINQHGGCLDGYVKRYGSKNDPDHYGDGGEAIYAADHAYYLKLCREAGLLPADLDDTREYLAAVATE